MYFEVKLQGNHTMFCDIKDYKLLRSRIWCAHKERNTYYCHSKGKRFHRLIHPKWKSIDHINRNGLDNRRLNLRDGSNGINEKNCKLFVTNTSGYNGIHYDKQNKAWVFEWREQGNRKKNTLKDFKTMKR